MDQLTKVILSKARNMDKESSLGKMGRSTMGNGIKKGKKDENEKERELKRERGFILEEYKFLFGGYISLQTIFCRICGVGVSVWSDGRRYEGEWYNNCMHGKGIYTWPDGRKYEGEYNYDKKHGYGILTWTDNRRFEGCFV